MDETSLRSTELWEHSKEFTCCVTDNVLEWKSPDAELIGAKTELRALVRKLKSMETEFDVSKIEQSDVMSKFTRFGNRTAEDDRYDARALLSSSQDISESEAVARLTLIQIKFWIVLQQGNLRQISALSLPKYIS